MREVAVVRIRENPILPRPYELMVDVGPYRMKVMERRYKTIKEAERSALRLAKTIEACKAGVDVDIFEAEDL